MERTIYDCEQGTDEWFECRMGLPTASMFSTVMAKGRGKSPSKTRETYLRKLAGEILTGEPMDSFTNAHMERGKVMEEEAVARYAFEADVEPQTVGFIRLGDIAGCSPDRLIGTDGLNETKTKLPHLQIEVLLADKVPEEHMPQIQGQLWISGREWCDFISYWPKMPMFLKRVYRDEAYIKTLEGEVARFNDELHSLVEKIKGYGLDKAA